MHSIFFQSTTFWHTSGLLSTFSKGKEWFISENIRSSDDVSKEINAEIKSIIKPWRRD